MKEIIALCQKGKRIYDIIKQGEEVIMNKLNKVY